LRERHAGHDGADVEAGCVYCCPLGVVSLQGGAGATTEAWTAGGKGSDTVQQNVHVDAAVHRACADTCPCCEQETGA
jgi:hypothetical protein